MYNWSISAKNLWHGHLQRITENKLLKEWMNDALRILKRVGDQKQYEDQQHQKQYTNSLHHDTIIRTSLCTSPKSCQKWMYKELIVYTSTWTTNWGGRIIYVSNRTNKVVTCLGVLKHIVTSQNCLFSEIHKMYKRIYK